LNPRRVAGNRGDDYAYSSSGKQVDELYAYRRAGKLFITRHGYAQIVGGWLDFEGMTSKQMEKIDIITREFESTGYIWVASRRKGYDVYAYPFDCKGKEPVISFVAKIKYVPLENIRPV